MWSRVAGKVEDSGEDLVKVVKNRGTECVFVKRLQPMSDTGLPG